MNIVKYLNRPHFLIAVSMFACAFVLSLLLVYCIRKWASSWGLVDKPGSRKLQTKAIPLGGGIALVFSLLATYAASWYWVHNFRTYSSVAKYFTQEMLVIIAGGLVIAVMGLIDDWQNLKPNTKIFIVSIIAWGLYFCNIRVTLFVQNAAFSFVVTWGWVLLITNAFNLLDNMDGLSGGVAFISGMIFLVVATQTEQWGIVFMLVGMLGSLLGFLYYNFPPASIFMGDCGALFIGYLMSVLTIHATFYQPQYSLFPIALPLLVMAVPLFDTGTVAWLRWRTGRPIFQGDRQHFSHRLVKLGLNQRQAVLTIYLTTFATGISATLLYQTNWIGGSIIVLQIIAILTVIRVLEQVGAKVEEKR